jgi:pimeloyl-ACP methyl ester carboxylesterase
MDQARFETLLRTFQSRCAAEHKIRDLVAVPGQVGAPIVVLVHGIGGNARHWSDPAALNPNETWLFDLKSEPPPARTGILTSPPYAPGSVTNWCRFLQSNHISYINYSIGRPDDLLQHAMQELIALLRMLEQTVFEPYTQELKAGGQLPRLIILCHSRGGLVTRAALKQLGSAGLPHLSKVISLTTPHQGSYMPRLANDYNKGLQTALDFSGVAQRLPVFVRPFFEQAIDRYVDTLANGVREAMLHSFGTLAQGPGFEELIPDGATLTSLAQGERPLPNVRYFGIGGSNPVFVNFYLSGLGQAFYLMAAVGSFLLERLALLPGISTNYGGLAEMIRGDSAVSVTSSMWPSVFGAQHQEFKINHMQALIDPDLQRAVHQIIRS